ncbi:hypothetical protein V9T40_013147 [Parthenolecanium corni]|uniref:Uncharacterized protein n=1 Tax=Parthenolecanium corni TaxID=536013 RepID=A0AAN9TJC9_9HEMI
MKFQAGKLKQLFKVQVIRLPLSTLEKPGFTRLLKGPGGVIFDSTCGSVVSVVSVVTCTPFTSRRPSTMRSTENSMFQHPPPTRPPRNVFDNYVCATRIVAAPGTYEENYVRHSGQSGLRLLDY